MLFASAEIRSWVEGGRKGDLRAGAGTVSVAAGA
jgi:hypothetical protein